MESQLTNLKKDYNQLITELQGQKKLQQDLANQIQQQQQSVGSVVSSNQEQLVQLAKLQEKLSTKSNTDANLWLLAEANFLVKQAVRKLNNDHDIATARVLLVSADANLVELNDPSLNNVRSLIAKDSAMLGAISRVDADGVIIKLEQLSDQLETLSIPKRIEFGEDGIIIEQSEEDLNLSDSISDWRQNLTKSWKSFMAGFITVQNRNPNSDPNKPELNTNQFAYLRENIRMQLLIAAQATPRQQQVIYDHAIAKALAWTKSYFDTEASEVSSFIVELEKLQSTTIQETVPTELASQPLLEKIVRERVRDLLAKMPVEATGGRN